MIFQRLRARLFKPKWQHRKPEVRKQAIAMLDIQENQAHAILAQVARHDTEPQVRRVAIKRLADLDLLQEIARADLDASNRELAGQRFLHLLAGNAPDAPVYEKRVQVLAQTEAASILEFVAVNGKEPELRLAALQRVERDALFGDLAINDADAQVRLAALERVTQKPTLERVAKMSRNRDKRVSHMARDRLTALIEEEERPARLRAQRENICTALEALGRGSWERDQVAFERLETQWQQLEGIPEADLDERFQRARERFLGLLEAYRTAEAERQRREQTYALRREQKRALYDEVERLLADLKGHGTRDTETEVPARIESLQARWAEIEPLPEPEETQFRERFAKATQAVLVRYQELQRLREVEARMRDLVNQAETLCAAETPVPERQVKDLERQGQALERPADLVPDLDRRFEEALQGLRMRLQQQREQRDQALNQLKALLPDSEAAAEGGELKKAKTLLGQAQRLAKNLAGLAPDQLPSLEARLQAVSAKVHQLQDWQRWATTREKEKLCAEVEALIGSTTDPIELDRQIREARAAWKRLVTSDPGSAQVLWERFNTACTQAYQPCQAHFDEQARQRQENQAKKEALCERMERYATEADWEHMDWKALEGMLRSGRQEWNAIGPIDRKVRTELNKRFDAAMNHLAHHLAEERERNAAKKLALVERAESLVGSLSEATDLRDSIRQIKQAQAEWKAIGPAPRRQEQELWKRFRAAADAIFERRKQQAEVQQTERATRLEHKQTLCAQVEELSQLEGEGLVQAQAQVRRAQSEWETIGPTPKEATETIQRRFREACDRFFERYREHLKAVDRERLERLREKAALCTQVEALVAHANGEEARQRAEAIRERWQTLLPLEDRLERPIRERFDKAFNLVLQSDPERLAQLKQEQQANLEAKEILCIRMELLAGIESPPEAAEARLKYQVGQLSAGMKRGRGADEGSPRAQALQIEEAWYLSASIPPEKVDALERRFQRAREAFYAKEGPETHAAS